MFTPLDAIRSAFVVATFISASSTLVAQVPAPVTLLKEGDTIAGVGNVTFVFNVVVNDAGEWIVHADTDFPDTTRDNVLVKNGALFLREGDPIAQPAGAVLSVFDDLTLGNNGGSSFDLFLANLPASQDSGLYFNGTLVVPESGISTAPQFTPGTPYVGFFGTKFVNDATPAFLACANVDDPALASSVDGAMVLIEIDNAGNLIAETAIAKEGDVLPGVSPDAVLAFGTSPYEFALNASHVALYTVDLGGPASTNQALYLDQTLLVRKGDVSPFNSRTWDAVGSALDLNDSNEYVFRGNLSGATGDDEIIVRNGSVKVVEEGDVFPESTGLYSFTSFGTGNLQIGPGPLLDTIWYGKWNDPDSSRDSGLFRHHQLLVQEGVTLTGGGELIAQLASVVNNFDLSSNGRYLIFHGELEDGIDAAMLLDLSAPTSFCFGDGLDPHVTTPCPCGNAGDLGHGCGNSVSTGGALLSTSGSIVPDSVQLTIADVPPGTVTIYIQGNVLITAGAVFGDGILCAGGQLTRMGSKNDSDLDGVTTFGPASGDPQISVAGSVVAGSTYAYQTYYRNADPGWCPPATFNVSQGIKIEW